ncbi:MAG: DUF411 domain-containing protein [Pseudomonadota bacterium]|nr:DUF411 domain-containing protein [Pseudomonadota bacterium]
MDRRTLLLSGLATLALGGRTVADETPVMMVYKSPTCGCCNAWIEHVEAAGFRVAVQNMPDVTAVKTRFGVPQALWSCHTALVGDYVVEGHVPAEDIARMLAETPQITGIAVPGMPAGSPGMEVPGYSQPYDVYAFSPAGREVFASHAG